MDQEAYTVGEGDGEEDDEHQQAGNESQKSNLEDTEARCERRSTEFEFELKVDNDVTLNEGSLAAKCLFDPGRVTAKTQAGGMEKVRRRSLKFAKSGTSQKRRYSWVNGIGDNNNEQVLSDAYKVSHMVVAESKNGSNNIKLGGGKPETISENSINMEKVKAIGEQIGIVWESVGHEECLNGADKKGVGTEDKKGWIKAIRHKESPDMIALQETKSKIIDEVWIEEVWGSSNFGYVQKEANGRFGGLLLVWDSNIFVCKHGVGDERFVAVKGEWKGVDGDILFVCVYGPHVGQQKTSLWNRLLNLMEGGNEAWCLLGDFNEVRSEEDRKNTQFHEIDADGFNDFINLARLVEIPMGGIKKDDYGRSRDNIEIIEEAKMRKSVDQSAHEAHIEKGHMGEVSNNKSHKIASQDTVIQEEENSVEKAHEEKTDGYYPNGKKQGWVDTDAQTNNNGVEINTKQMGTQDVNVISQGNDIDNDRFKKKRKVSVGGTYEQCLFDPGRVTAKTQAGGMEKVRRRSLKFAKSGTSQKRRYSWVNGIGDNNNEQVLSDAYKVSHMVVAESKNGSNNIKLGGGKPETILENSINMEKVKAIGEQIGIVWESVGHEECLNGADKKGVGTEDKKGWIKAIRHKESPDMIALQETKSKIIDEVWIEEVWGSSNFGYVQKEANGRFGGLLLVWDSNIFVCKHGVGDERFVAVKGEWKGVDGDIFFVCVYGPHVGQQKTSLWNRLLNLMEGGNEAWCLLGDFNEVRSEEDRKNTQFHETDADGFNDFINLARLVEIPMGVCSFSLALFSVCAAAIFNLMREFRCCCIIYVSA
ncbi:RNA-directed DNA polymerase, eukaryota [Artemisia annua]|uniref:RNA-directed DNA polymerase, eukaryota n=1 Tax=Artemisia annua TaxID=35608 RepID=A0A2U1MHB9_ARTAN|nr:RNA-directed DNA polymerase, eukaryota [Artemisia annua]